MPEERRIARCDSLRATLLPQPALPPRLGRFLHRIAAAALWCSCRAWATCGCGQAPCSAGSARRAAPARSLACGLRGDDSWGHADARAGRRAVAGASESDRHRCRVPRLADPGHGPARRDPQLPAATTWQAGPWSPASRAAMEQAMRFRRRAIRPRTPGSLAPSSCAATGNATPCASWKSGWGRPGSPSSCRRTARRRPVDLVPALWRSVVRQPRASGQSTLPACRLFPGYRGRYPLRPFRGGQARRPDGEASGRPSALKSKTVRRDR